MRLVIERAASLEPLIAAGWDDLLGPRDLYLSLDWQRVLALSTPLQTSYLAARQHRDEPVVAGLATYLIESHTTVTRFHRIDQILARLGRPDGEALVEPWMETLLPNLLCGGRQIAYTRLLINGEQPEDLQQQATGELLQAAEVEASTSGARSLMFPYVDADDRVLRGALTARGYAEFYTAYRCVLPLRARAFEGYVSGLSGNARAAVRRELRTLQRAGVVLATQTLTPNLVPELVPLELALMDKHNISRGAEEVERGLMGLVGALPNRVLLHTARISGDLLAFASMTRWRNWLFARHIGVDYERTGDLPAYFAVMFYEPIQFGLAHDIERIEYGTGSYTAKQRRGCSLEAEVGYAKCLDAESHAALVHHVDTFGGGLPSTNW